MQRGWRADIALRAPNLTLRQPCLGQVLNLHRAGRDGTVLGFAAFIYGLTTSVTLSICGRNHQLGRAHPPVLLFIGYMLCGMSCGAAALLGLIAASGAVSL